MGKILHRNRRYNELFYKRPEFSIWEIAGSIFSYITISYLLKQRNEKSTLYYRSNTNYRMVAGRIRLGSRKPDSHTDRSCDHCIIAWYNQESIDDIIFLIYTVHSISKATVLYCSHFLFSGWGIIAFLFINTT